MPAWATGRKRPPRRGFRLSRSFWMLLFAGVGALALYAWLPEAPFDLDGQPLVGPVERVADGDTIEIAGQRIRLTGLDAPEWDQTCTATDGARWTCGRAAADRMRQLVRGETLSCTPHGHDRYRRLLATCRAGKADIAEALVRDGLAVATDSYGAAEREARRARRGMWGGQFVTPADWRAGIGRDEAGTAGNPSRFERFMSWLVALFSS